MTALPEKLFDVDQGEARIRVISIRVSRTRGLAASMMTCAIVGGLASQAYFRIAAGATLETKKSIIIQVPSEEKAVADKPGLTGLNLNSTYRQLELYSMSLGLLFSAGCTFVVLALYVTTMKVLLTHISLEEFISERNPQKVRLRTLKAHGIAYSSWGEIGVRVLVTVAPITLSALLPKFLETVHLGSPNTEISQPSGK